jgi:oxygen-independent coproporphyrinogen III oxidase
VRTEPGPSTLPDEGSDEKAMGSLGPAAAGVYVHVPFCRRRCPYCDFAFEVRPADPRYAPALLAEMAARRGELSCAPATLSFGGGTPSALPAADLAALVAGARSILALPADAEVSLELNPEDVLAAPAAAALAPGAPGGGVEGPALPAALAAAGFSRASLGVQSFDDGVLRWLGRAHDAAGARASVRACVEAGLRTAVDLIVGVPGEPAARLARDVDELLALGATHVSAYLLTVEPETPLVQLIAQQRRAPVDDDAQAAAYEELQRLLAERGLTQYEVSSYSIPGEESRHNRIYWQGGAYLGLGPSAHSMRPLEDGSVLRRHTRARFDAWLADPAGAARDEEVLPPAAAFLEAVAFGLRDLGRGVSLEELAARHHLGDARSCLRVRAALLALGDDVLEGADGRLRLSARGARFADRAARAVLAADDDRR